MNKNSLLNRNIKYAEEKIHTDLIETKLRHLADYINKEIQILLNLFSKVKEYERNQLKKIEKKNGGG